MPGRANYYEVLGISSSANAAEIRRAYREQALLHHPDKNPDRIEEATERFKLIAEAYSVLNDAKQRAAYDAGTFRATNFNMDRARDLFNEVFGSDFADKLAQAVGKVAVSAKPHVMAAAETTASGLSKAAEHAGRTSVVRDAVAAQLNCKTNAAKERATMKRQELVLRRKTWEDQVKLLEDHAAGLKSVYQTRKERQGTWWDSVLEWATGAQKAEDEAFDRNTRAKTTYLQKQVEAAELACQSSQKELSDAEALASKAQTDEEDVQRNGAKTMAHALMLGTHLVDRFAEKLNALDQKIAGTPRPLD